MIVSHRYRYIFIKTKKTAGTSIEIALSRHCGPRHHHAAGQRRRGAARAVRWPPAAEHRNALAGIPPQPVA